MTAGTYGVVVERPEAARRICARHLRTSVHTPEELAAMPSAPGGTASWSTGRPRSWG
ncbi:hypothetical protein [Nocardiopsis sp. FIRDI 009]|uniref:hypothetical protein n=1 Tax=Nocardiopsis sp. FIRDI 009 TaxID=714197 RepID=UPI00130088DA|nr:hypothetical protein [Nocardiopsis sp. FIRDI 009]